MKNDRAIEPIKLAIGRLPSSLQRILELLPLLELSELPGECFS